MYGIWDSVCWLCVFYVVVLDWIIVIVVEMEVIVCSGVVGIVIVYDFD